MPDNERLRRARALWLPPVMASDGKRKRVSTASIERRRQRKAASAPVRALDTLPPVLARPSRVREVDGAGRPAKRSRRAARELQDARHMAEGAVVGKDKKNVAGGEEGAALCRHKPDEPSSKGAARKAIDVAQKAVKR
jgi:hypothetical protein